MVVPRLTLQQFARITAELDAGLPRAEVLARAGLDATAWQVEQRAWLGTIAARSEQRHPELVQRYTAEYLAARRALLPAKAPAAAPAPRLAPSVALAPVASAPAAAPPRVPTMPPAPPPVPQEPAEPKLTLYEFAMMSAELAVSPEYGPQICGKYGLASQLDQQSEITAWRNRMQHDRALRDDYASMYRDAELHWKSLRRR